MSMSATSEKRKEARRKRRERAGVLFITGLVLVTAARSASAEGSSSCTLYEVMEAAPPRPSSGGMAGVFIPGPGGSITRLAQATLSGQCSLADGSLAGWAAAVMEAHAQSRINVFTGSGPFSAVFTVDDAANGSTAGKGSGTLDMSAMLDALNPLPWAFVSGSWGTLGDPSTRQGGALGGTACVPIACPHDATKACYLGKDWSVTELGAHEYEDGIPLVKFVLEYVAP